MWLVVSLQNFAFPTKKNQVPNRHRGSSGSPHLQRVCRVPITLRIYTRAGSTAGTRTGTGTGTRSFSASPFARPLTRLFLFLSP